MAWLRKYKPEEQVIDEAIQARMDAGREVGNLARGLFGDYTDVTSYKNGRMDLSQMIQNTEEEMAKGTSVICEASFDYNGLYCAVDILKKEDDGWAIYEVKSSTKDDKPIYHADVAYQKYVLEHCGVNVTGTFLVVLNNEYVFDGTMKLNELFRITDISEEVKNETGAIEYNFAIAEKLLN
ncbi:MAG: Dna2/Cas4 domain-containing protein, partial [Lachnospiraceae bacterium]|nr:Dna2/Cas4 domain-containing protein [Lachnospiraceae bacterium]